MPRSAEDEPRTTEDEPRPARPQVAGIQPRPTSAPRQDREATPASRREALTLQLGKVVARQGMNINTVHPRWPVTAGLSIPANPDVQVTFDKSGKVTSARIVRSTGYANLDGPLLTSLYKWTATGELFESHPEDRLTLEVHILLSAED